MLWLVSCVVGGGVLLICVLLVSCVNVMCVLVVSCVDVRVLLVSCVDVVCCWYRVLMC